MLKTCETETMIAYYLIALGSYRGLYILNWIYRYYNENYYDLIAVVAGIVQTVIFGIVFVRLVKMRKVANGQLSLNSPTQVFTLPEPEPLPFHEPKDMEAAVEKPFDPPPPYQP